MRLVALIFLFALVLKTSSAGTFHHSQSIDVRFFGIPRGGAAGIFSSAVDKVESVLPSAKKQAAELDEKAGRKKKQLEEKAKQTKIEVEKKAKAKAKEMEAKAKIKAKEMQTEAKKKIDEAVDTESKRWFSNKEKE